jgi:hypothetical protein
MCRPGARRGCRCYRTLSGRYRDFRLPRLRPKGRSSISVSAAAARWRLSSRMWPAFASGTKHKPTLLLDVLDTRTRLQPSAADGQPLGIVGYPLPLRLLGHRRCSFRGARLRRLQSIHSWCRSAPTQLAFPSSTAREVLHEFGDVLCNPLGSFPLDVVPGPFVDTNSAEVRPFRNVSSSLLLKTPGFFGPLDEVRCAAVECLSWLGAPFGCICCLRRLLRLSA